DREGGSVGAAQQYLDQVGRMTGGEADHHGRDGVRRHVAGRQREPGVLEKRAGLRSGGGHPPALRGAKSGFRTRSADLVIRQTASSSLILSTNRSNTRSTCRGCMVTWRNRMSTSRASTNSMGSPPRATTTPSSGGRAPERCTRRPSRNSASRSLGNTSDLLGLVASRNKV